MISAEVICDSISPQEKRLTTFKLRYPRFVHSEFMTHRVISRNASSSRAIPTAKLIEEVRSDALRAAPVFWGKNQKGMQAAEELDKDEREIAQGLWRIAALEAAGTAEAMNLNEVHKQIVNRLLEPFSHINVVATATEWDNFFGLRLHKDAQPEMRALAIAMWEARKASTPKLLKPGDWHLPFVPTVWPSIDYATNPVTVEYIDEGTTLSQQTAIKVSVARCARVSYESFETGKRSTVEEDLKLYDRLLSAQPLHASPAEHQATPDSPVAEHEAMESFSKQTGDNYSCWKHRDQWGNFVGWRQYRKMLPGEAVAPIPEEFR